MEAAIGVIRPQAKDYRQTLKAQKGKEWIFLPEPLACNPADTLISTLASETGRE